MNISYCSDKKSLMIVADTTDLIKTGDALESAVILMTNASISESLNDWAFLILRKAQKKKIPASFVFEKKRLCLGLFFLKVLLEIFPEHNTKKINDHITKIEESVEDCMI